MSSEPRRTVLRGGVVAIDLLGAPATAVGIEDGAIASSLFDRLMGDDVEPRREFIEKNARYVKNLDI